MDQEVPFEAYSLASAEVEGAAEILEASVTLGLALEKAGVHEENLLEVVAALAQLVFVQVSQSSIAVQKRKRDTENQLSTEKHETTKNQKQLSRPKEFGKI